MRTPLEEVHRICDASWWGDKEASEELARINAEMDAYGVPSAREILERGFAKSVDPKLDPQSP